MIDEQEAWKRMTRFCSQAEHCPFEVSEKLRRWSLPYEAVTRIVQTLEAEGYLNEERYCRAFVRDKYRFDKWGRIKIAQALQMKQLPLGMIQIALEEEVDEDEYRSYLSALLQAKRRALRATNDYELRGKLMRFALGRGFEGDEVERCWDVLDEK